MELIQKNNYMVYFQAAQNPVFKISKGIFLAATAVFWSTKKAQKDTVNEIISFIHKSRYKSTLLVLSKIKTHFFL